MLLRAPIGGTAQGFYTADGERLSVEMEVRPDAGQIRLQHPSRASYDAPRMDYAIRLVWTCPGFSGRRWWFVCPVSGRRCSVLYLPRGAYKFASAKGYGLVHGVTRLAPHDRLWRRMSRIAQRLGDEPDVSIPPRRPKWMRTTTYARHLDAWHEAAERRDLIYDIKIAGFLARLEGRLGG